MERVGIVLCGGRSQRMGRPKALLPWFGRSLIEHAVATLAPAVEAVVVVTSPTLDVEPLVEPLGARVVVDREPDRGPLAAIRDGLAASGAEAAFVTSTDSPFLERDHVDALFARAFADRARGGPVRAVAPVAEGYVQVLSAVYPGTAWREADALLAAGIALPVVLMERLGYEPVREAARTAVAPWTGFNTPEAYLALARERDPAASARVEWRRAGGATETLHVPIGRLADVLRAAAGTDRSRIADLGAPELRIVLAGERLEPRFDPALPVGPGDRLVVESGRGATASPDESRPGPRVSPAPPATRR